MLAELAVDDLVLIATARLEFAPGLNVITGETGAGKSLLAQAIGLLMGQRGGDELVRGGAERALVQALFESPNGSIAVAREFPRGGRSRARIDGLLSSAAAVEDALQQRLAFYGQLEHTRLLQLDQQLRLLDGAAADLLDPLARAYEAAYAEARTKKRHHDSLCATRDERAHELDLLRFQIDEIARAGLAPGEDTGLERERERMRHAARLLERVGGAYALLAGDDEGASAVDSLRAAHRLVAEAASFDGTLEPVSTRLDALCAELDDVAAVLRAYVDDLDVDPARRDALELRHDQIKTLLRKYGDSVEAVLEFAAAAEQRLAAAERQADDEDTSAAAAAAAEQRAIAAARALGDARRSVAPRVAAQVEGELRTLAMPHATFAITVSGSAEAFSDLGPHGADQVEFVFSANPGVAARPLRETASGGELSRAMLAIRGIVTLADDVETLVFDEVDQGIGGRTASALGERLARLATTRQVLCITHLPQVAAYAQRHFALVKESDLEASSTRTSVALVEGEQRLAELCRMLGADADDAAAREHAATMLTRAGHAL